MIRSLEELFRVIFCLQLPVIQQRQSCDVIFGNDNVDQTDQSGLGRWEYQDQEPI